MGLLPGGPLAGREVSPMKGVFVKEKVANNLLYAFWQAVGVM